MTSYDDINARAQLLDRLALMRDLAAGPRLAGGPLPVAAGGSLRRQPALLGQPHALGHWLGTQLVRLGSRRAARPAA